MSKIDKCHAAPKRLLDNLAIRVCEWHGPISRQWLEVQFQCIGEIRLVEDGTKFGFGNQLLIVCFVHNPCQSVWLGQCHLAKKQINPVNLLVYWETGEKEPRCLTTNLPNRQMTRRYYSRRMWIEEMFEDFEKHGFDLKVRCYVIFFACLVLPWLWICSNFGSFFIPPFICMGELKLNVYLISYGALVIYYNITYDIINCNSYF